jgi:hypothetical protein
MAGVQRLEALWLDFPVGLKNPALAAARYDRDSRSPAIGSSAVGLVSPRGW